MQKIILASTSPILHTQFLKRKKMKFQNSSKKLVFIFNSYSLFSALKEKTSSQESGLRKRVLHLQVPLSILISQREEKSLTSAIFILHYPFSILNSQREKKFSIEYSCEKSLVSASPILHFQFSTRN